MKNITYLIYNASKKAILIDPSWQRDKYDAALSEGNLNLSAIFLTHHHIDHVNLAAELSTIHNCPVYMNKDEIDYYKFSCLNLQPILSDVGVLDICGIQVKVIRTSGHTYGGVCYWIDNNLFTGDSLFIEGCGMCSGEGADPVKMFESMQKLKELIPNETLIYPGHQYHYKIGKSFDQVKNSNIYLSFKTVDEFVKFRMRPGQRGLLNFT